MFPSPIGELHFSITPSFFVITPLKTRFPSPIGELHFSISYEKPKMLCRRSFPSPIGELHFSIVSEYEYIFGHPEFPSPIGELHFSIGYLPHTSGSELPAVSVPYRGATFLNRKVAYAE